MRQRKNVDEVYIFSLSGVDRPKENVLPSRSTKKRKKTRHLAGFFGLAM